MASLAQCWVVGSEGVYTVSGGSGPESVRGLVPQKENQAVIFRRRRKECWTKQQMLPVGGRAGQGVGSMEQAGELICLKWVLPVAYSIRGGL